MTTKSLSEAIIEDQNALNAKKDELLDATKMLEDNPTDDAQLHLVDALASDVEQRTKSLDAKKRAEVALSAKSTNVREAVSAAIIKQAGEKADSKLLVKAALCEYEGKVRSVNPLQVAQERFGDNEFVKAAVQMTVKGVQGPAVTSVPSYAGALVRDSYGSFVDQLAGISVVAGLPMQRYSFEGFAPIKIPVRQASTFPKNMEGAFRKEGDPIRVGALSLVSKQLDPYSLGVIGTFTEELLERSTPSIVDVIHNAMLMDTSRAIDVAFLGNNAAVAGVQPAGIQNGLVTTAGATQSSRASSGTTAANIITDLRTMVQALTSLNLGVKPVWIMNPARAMGAGFAQTAAGGWIFRDELASNRLMGIPIVTSVHVPATDVFLVDAAQMAFADGLPRFLASQQATIHEEDTTPLALNDGTVVAKPVRSLYQTASHALRLLWPVSWTPLQTGAVQHLSGANW